VDPELKSKWIAALRSGEYKQGKGYLRDGDTWCCLGVLATIQGYEVPDKTETILEYYWKESLGYNVHVLAGMNDGSLEQVAVTLSIWEKRLVESGLPLPIYPEDLTKRYTFLEIADYIERTL
jgi:hypothetical protein